MVTVELGTRITELRQRLRLSRREAALKAGISKIYWTHLELGIKKSPSATVLKKVAYALDCTVADLYAPSTSPRATAV
jgi:transcriptional regulator with XRE-family HTH domain